MSSSVLDTKISGVRAFQSQSSLHQRLSKTHVPKILLVSKTLLAIFLHNLWDLFADMNEG